MKSHCQRAESRESPEVLGNGRRTPTREVTTLQLHILSDRPFLGKHPPLFPPRASPPATSALPSSLRKKPISTVATPAGMGLTTMCRLGQLTEPELNRLILLRRERG